MLLNSLIVWSQNNDSIVPLRAIKSNLVLIPIETIKAANIKLIERKHYINIVNQQDSIISMKDSYIREQHKVIIDFQKRVYNSDKLNEQINNDINKYKRKYKILKYGAAGIITGCIIGVLIK